MKKFKNGGQNLFICKLLGKVNEKTFKNLRENFLTLWIYLQAPSSKKKQLLFQYHFQIIIQSKLLSILFKEYFPLLPDLFFLVQR